MDKVPENDVKIKDSFIKGILVSEKYKIRLDTDLMSCKQNKPKDNKGIYRDGKLGYGRYQAVNLWDNEVSIKRSDK